MTDQLKRVCRAFRIEGQWVSYEEISVGNINHTYKVNFIRPDGQPKSYIVQRVNTYVYKNPIQVMENIDRVTEHIRAKKPGQTALHFHHTIDRKTYFVDTDGFWRLFNYIPSDSCVEMDLDAIHNAGEAFGEFQMQLSDFDPAQLYETIVNFHNTPWRYEKLERDVKEDLLGRVDQVREELEREGIPMGHVDLGIMIETPAAAILSGELAEKVDFFSIGTNDLTQYTLAADRQNDRLDDFYDPRHPAVLRLIAYVAENAQKAGIRAGICGELAADPSLTEVFLKMGIRELSVSPSFLLPLRKRIREICLEETENDQGV